MCPNIYYCVLKLPLPRANLFSSLFLIIRSIVEQHTHRTHSNNCFPMTDKSCRITYSGANWRELTSIANCYMKTLARLLMYSALIRGLVSNGVEIKKKTYSYIHKTHIYSYNTFIFFNFQVRYPRCAA